MQIHIRRDHSENITEGGVFFILASEIWAKDLENMGALRLLH